MNNETNQLFNFVLPNIQILLKISNNNKNQNRQKMLTPTSILQLLTNISPNPQILQITDSSRGVDQQVKIVKYKQCKKNGKKYNNSIENKQHEQTIVIKYPISQPDKILHEIVGCERAHYVGVPVPQVLYSNDRVLIEKFVEGQILSHVKTSQTNFRKIYRNMGIYLKKMHSNTGTGYGKITSKKLKGMHPNLNPLKQNILNQIQTLISHGHYSPKFLSKLQKYISGAMLDIRQEKRTSMLHGDYCQDNILSTNEQIKGIVDFGDLAMGCPMEDFARLYIKHYGTYKWHYFIQGYGNIDLMKIQFYVVYFGLWRINSILDSQSRKLWGTVRRLEKAIWRIINR